VPFPLQLFGAADPQPAKHAAFAIDDNGPASTPKTKIAIDVPMSTLMK